MESRRARLWRPALRGLPGCRQWPRRGPVASRVAWTRTRSQAFVFTPFQRRSSADGLRVHKESQPAFSYLALMGGCSTPYAHGLPLLLQSLRTVPVRGCEACGSLTRPVTLCYLNGVRSQGVRPIDVDGVGCEGGSGVFRRWACSRWCSVRCSVDGLSPARYQPWVGPALAHDRRGLKGSPVRGERCPSGTAGFCRGDRPVRRRPRKGVIVVDGGMG